MSSQQIVYKYAKALFDVTYESGQAGTVAQQLVELNKAFDSRAVTFFRNPFYKMDTKLSIVKSSLEGKCGPEVFNFMCMLVEKNRIGLLVEISKEFTTLVQAAAGITKGKLYSPVEVSEAFLKQAEEKASKALSKKVQLTFEKDNSLLAGFKIQVGGWTMDDSAKTHLKILKEELLKKGL